MLPRTVTALATIWAMLTDESELMTLMRILAVDPSLATARLKHGASRTAASAFFLDNFLHYAADGTPGGAYWNPPMQAATIALLVEAGADPTLRKGRYSTPMSLATHNTGRGGAGSSPAAAEQAEIIGLWEIL